MAVSPACYRLGRSFGRIVVSCKGRAVRNIAASLALLALVVAVAR
jgi:hypothetical protein